MRSVPKAHPGEAYKIRGNPTPDHTKDPVEMVDTSTDFMAADLYTKAFVDPEKWEHAKRLVNVVHSDKLEELINGHCFAGRVDKSEAGKTQKSPCAGNTAEACSAQQFHMSTVPGDSDSCSGCPRVIKPDKTPVRRLFSGRRFAEVFSGVGHLAEAFAREGAGLSSDKSLC